MTETELTFAAYWEFSIVYDKFGNAVSLQHMSVN